MGNENKNFKKLLETIEKIRKEKYADTISQQLLIDLMNIENENIDKDSEHTYKLVYALIENYFKSKNLSNAINDGKGI